MPAQTFTITALAVPAAPSGLLAVPQSSTSILLTWADNSGTETGYTVLRRTGTDPFAALSGATALPPDSNSFLDTLCNADTTYDYQVFAYNAQGNSAVSNTATATTSPDPAPDPPPGTDPNVIPTGTEPGAPLYQWIDAAGDAHTLSDPNSVGVELGARGLLMPAIQLTESETPFNDGARITGVRVPAREIDLPILVTASTPMALRTQLRTLIRWFDPHRGDGILRVTDPDGNQRDLRCRYAGGLDGAADTIDQAGPDWWIVAVTLRAADPYFYATTPTTYVFSTAAPVSFFPLFPLRVSASSVVSNAHPDNTGDVEAWPIWTITGPATSLVLTNDTTGDSLSMNRSIAEGDTVVIDTRPGHKSVIAYTSGTPSNALGDLTPTSSLWPLTEGVNDLAITLSGSSDLSQVRLDYTPRYLSM